MDFSWANEDFMRQISSIVVGATLSALSAFLIFVLTALKERRSRKNDELREREIRKYEWWSARVAQFENELIIYLPVLSEWKRRQSYVKPRPIADHDDLLSIVAEGGAGELDVSKLPEILQSPTFAELERTLATLRVKAPSGAIRAAVDEARRSVDSYKVSVAMGMYVTDKSAKTPQNQLAELNARKSVAEEALDELVNIHSQLVDDLTVAAA